VALITGRRSPALPVGYVSVMTSLISQFLADSHFAVELIDIENLDLLYEAHTQGAIGVVFDDRLAAAALAVPNLPVLTINDPLVDQGVHSVRADHYQQGRIATEHYLARGHRQIGLLAVHDSEWGARERLRGYREAMEAAGVEIDPSWVQFTPGQTTYDILNRWIKRGVTGILNFSEDASLEVLHILSNVLRLKIGKDISVISLEDLPIYQYFTPPQTTVSQPLAELAKVAVATMLGLCEGPRAAAGPVVDLCLPTQLIERDSVATVTE
jgi:LacI family transcriptional regulator